MARMLCSKPCWAKAVSLSKVIDLRSAGFMRAKIASMTEMVSAAVFPASRAARVTRDFALKENEHGPRALADDEVALPMAGFGPSIDVLGPLVDGNAILDGISRRALIGADDGVCGGASDSAKGPRPCGRRDR